MLTKTQREKIKRLGLRISRTSYAEGVEEAGVGDGPVLDRRKKASRRALDDFLRALTEIEEDRS